MGEAGRGAEQLRAEGNLLYGAGRYREAEQQYSLALQLDSSSPPLFRHSSSHISVLMFGSESLTDVYSWPAVTARPAG